MEQLGIDEKWINVVKELFTHSAGKMKVDAWLTHKINKNRGLYTDVSYHHPSLALDNNSNSRKDTEKRKFSSTVENIIYERETWLWETWPMTEKLRNNMRTLELDFMTRSLQITIKDKWTTNKIWLEMEIH